MCLFLLSPGASLQLHPSDKVLFGFKAAVVPSEELLLKPDNKTQLGITQTYKKSSQSVQLGKKKEIRVISAASVQCVFTHVRFPVSEMNPHEAC